MNETELLPQNTPVDLTNCDKEPIHIPGSIQPHGILLVLEELTLNIVQVSQNTFDILGIPPQDILGEHLKLLFNNKQLNLIKQSLSEISEKINPLDLYIDTKQGRKNFDGIIHKSDQLIILELEIVHEENNHSDFLNFYKLVQPVICKLQKLSYLDELCQIIVKEIRNLTGFDRVMIYKFDSQEAGDIIAEDKLESLSPFLGLHYPASDIPKQARQLYTLNPLRLIPDVNYQSVELITIDNSINNQPLNLSDSVLRSVSPIHIEYMKNMGLTASMSISLIKDQKLWGLIACHHYSSSKYVSYKLRIACELLGRVMSLEISAKEENEYLDYKIILKRIFSDVLQGIVTNENWLEVLLENKSKLLELVAAEGVAVCNEENITIIGKTPVINEIKEIRNFLENRIFNQGSEDYVYQTDAFFQIYPKAEKFKDVCSGLLAIVISPKQKQYILWFRPEIIQNVNWAGNPDKPVEISADGSMRMSPRKSFELWKETVKLKSLPWKSCEIEIAKELRNAIVGLVLYKNEKIAKLHQQLMIALQVAKMGAWDWDLQQNQIVWAMGHHQLFGLVEEISINTYEALKALIDPRDQETVTLAINRALVEQHDYYQEFRVVWPDSSIHWIEGKGKFFLNDAGETVRFLGTMLEVSDRKLAEIQLQELNLDLENRVQNRTLQLEHSQIELQQQIERQRIFITISQQIRKSLNLQEILKTAAKTIREFMQADRVYIYQFEPDYSGSIVVESVGDDWMPLLNVEIKDTCFIETPTHAEKYKQGGFQALADIDTAGLTECHRDFLAQYQIKANLAVPILQEENLWGLLVANQCGRSREWQSWEIDFLQQLSNQMAIAIQQSELYQQLENELLQRQKIETTLRHKENMEKMKNEFMSIVSHELRTPLTSIRGCLGLLTATAIKNQPEKMQKILGIASSDAERLTRLLNDILDLERLETSNFKLDKKLCNVDTLIHHALDSMETIAKAKNISFDIESGSYQVLVDEDRILQTIINLINNAIKFSPPDTTIKVNVEEKPDSYLFKIVDQGRGIPKNKIESIFGKFQQVDASDSREKGGIGLGLAICRNIIEQHGGKIWAESVLNQGSTFYFSLHK
jgi:light-regulated signal transduction histidine kinase (bacteriophytochrome)